MKAAIYTQYGPPEVVQVLEVTKPVPEKGEVLIRVHCSTVNRTDSGFRSAEYFVSRFFSGLFRPKYKTLGCEFSGVIEALGEGVQSFSVGDRVFGYDDERFGGHAEYKCIAASGAIGLIPEGISFETAAASTEGMHYALNNIRAVGVQAGQKVLVYGATGAIGSAAVQLMSRMNVHVTAVCSTPYVSLVKSLGAEEVIDYTQNDYTKTQQKYDFVFDAVGKSSFKKASSVLTPSGIYISTELGKGGENIVYALWTPWRKGPKVLFPLPVMNQEMIEFAKTILIEGSFKPLIDRVYSLDQIVEAYRYVASGQKVGNVILKIQE
jgi:NADPH:quinone reductase-like Zn-dependent oxidoreductase